MLIIPIMYENQKENITQFFDSVEIVFVNITSDQCVTYQFIKIKTLYSIRTLDLINRKSVIAMQGELNFQNDEIYRFLTYYNIVRINFNAIYASYKPEGIILSLIIGYDDIVKSIIS